MNKRIVQFIIDGHKTIDTSLVEITDENHDKCTSAWCTPKENVKLQVVGWVNGYAGPFIHLNYHMPIPWIKGVPLEIPRPFDTKKFYEEINLPVPKQA